jgi:hypothetical protein
MLIFIDYFSNFKFYFDRIKILKYLKADTTPSPFSVDIYDINPFGLLLSWSIPEPVAVERYGLYYHLNNSHSKVYLIGRR